MKRRVRVRCPCCTARTRRQSSSLRYHRHSSWSGGTVATGEVGMYRWKALLLPSMVTALVASAGVSAAEPDYTWPQFRGPGGQGVSVEKGLPEEWSATRNVLWKTA